MVEIQIISMYSCTMRVLDPGGGGAVSVLKMCIMVFDGLVEVLGVLGCFRMFQWTARRLC